MAVLWQAGWDFLDSTSIEGLIDAGAGGAGTTAGALVGRYMTTGSYLSSNYQKIHLTGIASAWAHARMNVAWGETTSFSFGDPSVWHVGVGLNATGYVQAFRGSTILGTGTTQIPTASWNAYAAEVTISNTAGVVKVWVNGRLEINLANQDTNNGGTDLITRFQWQSHWNGKFDDIVVGDTTSPNGSAVTDLRVDAMRPDANGTDRDFSLSTGTDDFAVVDDTLANTSDYAYATAVGNKMSVNVAALTNAGGTILAVQASAYAQKNDAGPCAFKLYCLRGGTRYYSDEFLPVFGQWLFFQYIWNKDPSTDAAWTETNFNAAEFGTERTL